VQPWSNLSVGRPISSRGVRVCRACLGHHPPYLALRAASLRPELLRSIAAGNAPIDPRERAAATVPLPRVGEAQDIANGVLFLCTESANYMTGQELVIDGGMTAGGRPQPRS